MVLGYCRFAFLESPTKAPVIFSDEFRKSVTNLQRPHIKVNIFGVSDDAADHIPGRLPEGIVPTPITSQLSPNVSSTSREDINFALRSTNVDLVRSRSVKQAKISGGLMKTLKKKLEEAVSKFIIYERLPMNISNSPWLHNLIVAAAEMRSSVKCPTPYEVSDVYLEVEYKSMQEWINNLKTTWKEKRVTIMCDGWIDSVNHTHIMNFLVYVQ
ncbi:hypothetical protein Fmac_010650 [Flemingia macrophylla]|uniref:DUF659 domain-containing protein n=1 Tax=Flemingia macrophylla TaxID=520843 RepID=A0ABD1MK71_9FABA